MKIVCTPEMIDFLRFVAKDNTHKEIAILFNKCFNTNFSSRYIRLQMSKNGIPRNNYIWTPEMKKFIKENGKGKASKELLEMIYSRFGVIFTVEQIKWARKRYCPSCNSTGRLEVPLLSENNTGGYTFIKIGKGSKGWVKKHRWVWEQTHGPIPKGHDIIFLDGNKKNFELDNLALVTHDELIRLSSSSLRFDNRELTKMCVAIVRHKAVIDKRLLESLGKDELKKYKKRFKTK